MQQAITSHLAQWITRVDYLISMLESVELFFEVMLIQLTLFISSHIQTYLPLQVLTKQFPLGIFGQDYVFRPSMDIKTL